MRREWGSKLIGVIGAMALFGCQSQVTLETPEPVSDDLRLQTQAVGESSAPFWTKGEGTGLVPDYRARLLSHLYNRLRTSPQFWGFVYEDPPMSGMQQPFIPVPPARLDTFMAEAGRWQADHQLATGCVCDNAAVGYDPMDPATAPQEKFVNASCCEVGVVGGVAQCVGPLVPCTHPKATLRSKRWALLNRGPSEISNENIQSFGPGQTIPADALVGFMAENAQLALSANGSVRPGSAIGASFMKTKVVPQECLDREPDCPGGACVDQDTMSQSCDVVTNPDCLGLCAGGDNDNGPCSLPTPPQCPGGTCVDADTMAPACDVAANPNCAGTCSGGGNDGMACTIEFDCDQPDGFPVQESFIFSTGETVAPANVLNDGIHFQLAMQDDMGNPIPDNAAVPSQEAFFYNTPQGHVSFGVIYYETNGTPSGAPQSIEAIIGGSCEALTKLEKPDVLPVTGAPAPVTGDLYAVDKQLTQGCVPYVFVATDGDGFEYTYPTYGALQAKVNAEGNIDLNDETCPIWTSTRPDVSCVPSPQECDDGDTRPCYTGLYGTQDFGVCALGNETCVAGRWSGQCNDEILPGPEDLCNDGLDNDCNGSVDENCTCDYLGIQDGVCLGTGLSDDRRCVAPATYEEAESSCDGLDNDCDGYTDELCACEYKNSDVGVCGTATRDGEAVCQAPDTYEADEALCDGLDNDCDGAIDEGCDCSFSDKDAGVCASQVRDANGECPEPEAYETDESSCDGKDNDCDGEIDEGCDSTCSDSRDCRWEEGHGCTGVTGEGNNFCQDVDGVYQAPRAADATKNPECLTNEDCDGICEQHGLVCVNATTMEPSKPAAAGEDDTCGSPLDCEVGFYCEDREKGRRCVDEFGELAPGQGCGCNSTNGRSSNSPDALGLALFGLLALGRVRRRRRS